MEGIESLTSLESLWLGKNKIETVSHVGHFPKLKQLDIQNNRLTSLGQELCGLTTLTELYLACNAIESVAGGLPTLSPLSTLDLSNNKVADISGIDACTHLEELWMTARYVGL
jgi:protein phosphatase 1 regulatory subunit 7